MAAPSGRYVPPNPSRRGSDGIRNTMAASTRKQIILGMLCVLAVTGALAPFFLATHAQEPARPKDANAADEKRWQTVAPGRVEPWSGEIRIGSPAVGRIGAVLVSIN